MSTKLECGDLFVSGSYDDYGIALSPDQVLLIKPRPGGKFRLSRESSSSDVILKELADFPPEVQLAIRSIQETTDLPIFSRKFESSNFAIMRHAKDSGPTLEDWSVEQCDVVVEKLVEKLNKRDVNIFHNLLPRTKLTAEAVSTKLNACGIKTATKLVFWLGSTFGNKEIQSVCQGDSNTFSIFVTNAPYIKSFIYGDVDDDTPDPFYGSLFSKEFIIRSW
jgi:hypothetical protein